MTDGRPFGSGPACGNPRGKTVRTAALIVAFLAGCSSSEAQFVDSPRKSHTAVTTASRTMEYFGGPVIPNAKVYAVWWGGASGINSAVTAAHGGIADFFTGVTNSNFIDWLNE